MKELYIKAMDKLFNLSMWIAGISLIILTTVIPFNVFMRYVMNNAQSWPEPLAIVIMVYFTFFAGAVCYRANVHISVLLLVNATRGLQRKMLGVAVELLMIAFNLFVLWYGIILIETTWHEYVAEFPTIRVGLTYVPLPVGGVITLLFIVERLWTGALFPTATAEDSQGLD